MVFSISYYYLLCNHLFIRCFEPIICLAAFFFSTSTLSFPLLPPYFLFCSFYCLWTMVSTFDLVNKSLSSKELRKIIARVICLWLLQVWKKSKIPSSFVDETKLSSHLAKLIARPTNSVLGIIQKNLKRDVLSRF